MWTSGWYVSSLKTNLPGFATFWSYHPLSRSLALLSNSPLNESSATHGLIIRNNSFLLVP